MQSSKSPRSDDNDRPTHPPGAFGAWGFIIGAIGGALIGLYFDHWLASAFVGAALGWILGGLVDRSRL